MKKYREFTIKQYRNGGSEYHRMFYCGKHTHTYLHSDGVERDRTYNEAKEYTGYFKTIEDVKKAIDKNIELREAKGKTMNKRDAIKAMCDGEKVRYKEWSKNQYIHINEHGEIGDMNGKYFDINREYYADWEIYNEYNLSVEEAFKAVLDGKKVQHERWFVECYIGIHGLQICDGNGNVFAEWGNDFYKTGWKIIE